MQLWRTIRGLRRWKPMRSYRAQVFAGGFLFQLRNCMEISWEKCVSAQGLDSCAVEKDCSSGRNFPIGPDSAVAEELFLPDWHIAFQGIDPIAAGVKSGSPMRGADHDQHSRLTDFQVA